MNDAWINYFKLRNKLSDVQFKKVEKQLVKQLEKVEKTKLEMKAKEEKKINKDKNKKLPIKKKKANSKYNTKQLKLWKQFVFERDNYICQQCGSTTNLHAHHIKPKSEFIDLCYEINNGITLCYLCHREKHPNLPSKFFK